MFWEFSTVSKYKILKINKKVSSFWSGRIYKIQRKVNKSALDNVEASPDVPWWRHRISDDKSKDSSAVSLSTSIHIIIYTFESNYTILKPFIVEKNCFNPMSALCIVFFFILPLEQTILSLMGIWSKILREFFIISLNALEYNSISLVL